MNGVPITDVTTPNTPESVAILDFTSFREDHGKSIAADLSSVYLTGGGPVTENGVFSDTRLYIGQYYPLTDTFGVSPSVGITSFADGSEIIQDATVTVTASATDDVAVAAVTFFVDGQAAFTATAQPYQYTFTAPTTASALVLAATAIDHGHNTGVAPNVAVNVIPDPLTTAVGRVLTAGQVPFAGASVTCEGGSAMTGVDGTFSIPGIPTLPPTFTCTAQFEGTFPLRFGARVADLD